MPLKNKISSIGFYLIPVAVFLIYVDGCNHARKKHDIDVTNSNILFGWFYCAEQMWHKTDYSELNDNVRAAIYLLMSSPETIDPNEQIKFNEAKRTFKKSLANYSSKEKDYVREGAETYMKIKNDFEKSVANALQKYAEYSRFELSQSDSSIKLMSKLSEFGLQQEMKELQDSLNMIRLELKGNLEGNSTYYELIKEKKAEINSQLLKGINSRKRILDELFEL